MCEFLHMKIQLQIMLYVVTCHLIKIFLISSRINNYMYIAIVQYNTIFLYYINVKRI